MKHRSYIIASILILLASVAFAQQQTNQEVSERLLETKKIYPGLDRKVILEADSVYATVDVSEISKRIAEEYYIQAQEMKKVLDSLWAFRDKEKRVHEDSISAYNCYSKAMDYLKSAPYESGEILKKAKKYGRLDSTVINGIVSNLIPQISKTYGNAIRYNRFEIYYYDDFAKFLKKCYEKTNDISFINQAIEQHKKVIQLKKGMRSSYASLGDLYFIKKEWAIAYDNYCKAADILRQSAIFAIAEPDSYFNRLSEVPVDTNRMVTYLTLQAECKIHLYEAQPALKILRTARKLTPDPIAKEKFKKKIEWILWDDGNIRASELKDIATKIFNKQDYQTAKLKLIELLDILKTKRTKDEINYRIARVDFIYLDNQEEGIARLFRVIKYSKTDSITGVPVDSMYQQYFDSFGRMCFSLGSNYYMAQNLTYAYIYFTQAANIAYDERGKAYIQLANLSLFNPQESVELCKKALHYEKYLDEDSRMSLYETFYRAYRKLGDFAEARRWFDKWNGVNAN